jgi:hypothetical protein
MTTTRSISSTAHMLVDLCNEFLVGLNEQSASTNRSAQQHMEKALEEKTTKEDRFAPRTSAAITNIIAINRS